MYESGWGPEDLSTEQDTDPDKGPLMQWKRVGDDRPRWDALRSDRGSFGDSLALTEQGFYWPGMRLCHVEEEAGTREPLHQFIVRVPMERLVMDVAEPVLPDGGMLLLEMARVLPHPRPESHDGGQEAGVRDCGALWGIPRAA